MKNDLIHAMTESFEGQSVDNHCVGVNKMVEPGSGSQGEISEIMLNRCACYLIDQNSFMKAQWRVYEKRPVADFAPDILKEKVFTTEKSFHDACEQKIQSEPQKSQEHVTSNETVRKTNISRGIRLERMLPAEVDRKVKYRLTSAEMKAIKTPMGWMENEQ
jgi:DNA-damage-inducible protein D